MRPRIQASTFVAAILFISVIGHSVQSAEPSRRDREKPKTRPIVASKFDPSAAKVAMFDGMEDGTLEVKVTALGPQSGFVVIGNATADPLTVELPKAFVTVPVLKQFGGGGFGGQQGGFGGGGFGGGGFGGQQGGQQNQGGGFGGQGGGQFGGGGGFGGQQMGGGGQGFFSIPPEKAVKVPYVAACLNHGKADPNPRLNYQIIPVDAYTKDPVLKELITMVGTGRLASHAAQAAVWNRTDGMSFQQLASKFSYNSIGIKVPYFSTNQLVGAQQILATAIGRVRERGESISVPETTPVRRSVR